MGHFTIISKKKLVDLNVGDQLSESDFASLTPDGTFVQMAYHEEDHKAKPYEIKPGIWTIQKTMTGFVLDPTSFVNDKILESYVNITELTDKMDCFFRNLDVYKEHGIEVPRRAALLYGPPGSGKTSSIIEVSKRYTKGDNKTAVVVWSTDKFDAYEIKDFFRTFMYVGVERLILLVEDIGGVEIDQVRMKSTASLLSLLDNKEKTFTIPVFIVATTNFAENFLGNLTNRPGRFDDKIRMDNPNGQARYDLLKFYSKRPIAEETLQQVKHKKYADFSAAHLQEIVIRAAIYEITVEEAMDGVLKEINEYKKSFTDPLKPAFGLSNEPDYD